MFDISKYGFGFNRAFLAQSDALLGKQVLFGLLTKALKFKTNLNAAIAFCFCAHWFERTGGTMRTFIKSAFRKIARSRFIRLGFQIGQGVLGRTSELIFGRLVWEVD